MLRDVHFRQVLLGTHFWINIINASEYPCIPSKRGGYVYALIDPRDGRFRYLGKTIDPKGRYRSHLEDAKKYLYTKGKESWINELTERGYRPIMISLGTLPIEQLVPAERWFIELLGSYGCPLTNVFHGGIHSDAKTRLFMEVDQFDFMWSAGACDIDMYIDWLRDAGLTSFSVTNNKNSHPEEPIAIAKPCYVWGDCPNCNPGVREQLNRPIREIIAQSTTSL